jgi:thiamine pyrophosphate-dependent acetolactate synthase large subunit-like protein
MAGSGAKPENKVLAQPSWPDEVFRVLKEAGVKQVGMVPDAGHIRLIAAFEADPETRLVTLTTEEEGVAMLAGAWLGGQRGVLLLQSSGVGNCINMLSLPTICHMPLLMLVTMRGDWGEFNPWQIPDGPGHAGRARGHRRHRHPRGPAGSCRAGRPGRCEPRLQYLAAGGRVDRAARARRQEFQGACRQMTNPNALLHRRQVVVELLRDRGELLVIAGLGAPNWDVSAAGDHPNNFPLWGAMGAAAMMGLGLALAQPRRNVLVITGDGEMLMSLGALATIAVERPPNLTIVVLDNERFGETGMQKTHTASGVDLAGMALAAGIRTSRIVRTQEEVTAVRGLAHQGKGPAFALVKISPEALPFVMPPADGVILTTRFRQSVLGDEALYN